jgi:RNA polymerase sigma-70 factor (ECF subfamily)
LDMINLDGRETEELLKRAEAGDGRAVGGLFERHRVRLRRMVAARLDRRVAPRLDPSDVVQEAMGEASRRFREFLRDRPVPYYTWLRRLTMQHLSWSHRFHLRTRKRSAALDKNLERTQRGGTSVLGIDHLPGTDTSPSQHAVRDEECEHVRRVLDQVVSVDREFLELRYKERLSLEEIGEKLGIGISAVKMRHLRALKRFRVVLEGRPSEPAS